MRNKLLTIIMILFAAILVSAAPQFSGTAVNPADPATYVYGQNYQFNITWANADTVLIENNFIGAVQNDSATGNASGEFYFDISNLAAGTYSYRWFANDSLNEWNVSNSYTYTINKANPSMSLTGTTPITYGTAADVTGSETNNGDGDLTYELYRDNSLIANPDNTVLGAGAYNYAYNTTGGQNYTSRQLTFSLTVNKASTITALTTTPASPINYPAASNFSCSNSVGLDTILYIDTVDKSAEKDQSIARAAGTYTVNCTASDNANYTGSSQQASYTINKAASTTSLVFDKVSPQTYGTTIKATCTDTNPEASPTLLRNGTDVSAENGVDVTLGAGTYSYACNVSATQNYTSATNTSTFTIDKAGTTTTLYIDGAESDKTIGFGTQSNATAVTTAGTVTLYRNGTPVTNPEIAALAAGYYNYTAINSGDANYTGSSATWFLTVNKASAVINLSLDGTYGDKTYTYGDTITATGEVTTGDNGATKTLYRNGTSITNGVGQVLGAGYYNLTYVYSASENYTGTSITRFATVNKAEDNVDLYLNGNLNQNIAINFGDNLNATGIAVSNAPVLTRNGTDVTSENGQNVVLGAGVYEYKVTSNGNANYSANATGRTNYVTINQIAPILTLSASPSWTETYETQVNISCSANIPEVVVKLYRNGTEVTSENNQFVTLAGGVYSYVCNNTATQNYTSASASNTLTINPKATTLTMYIDGGAANNDNTITYGTQTNVTVISSNSQPFTIYRNGTIAASGSSPLSYTATLPAGYYNYTAIFAGDENYTAAARTNFETINKASAVINLSLDGTYGDRTYTYGDTITATGEVTTGDNGATKTLYLNGTSVGNPYSNVLGAGYYNLTYVYSDSQNYTGASVTRFATVNNANTTVNLTLNGAESNVVLTYPQTLTAIYSTNALTATMYRNGTDISSENNTAKILPVGYYNYTVVNPGNANYTGSTKTFFVTVNQNTSSALLSFAPSSPIVYGTSVTVSCSDTNPEAAAALYRNGTDVTAEIGVPTVLAVGTYGYVCNVSATQNYTAATNSSIFVVNTANTTVNLTLNGAESDLTLTYPQTLTAVYWTNALTATMYRNGTDVSAQNNSAIVLPAGYYNYTVVNPGDANYTGSSKTFFVTVNKNTTILTLTSNATWTANYPNATNVSCSASNSEVVPTLYRNGTNVGSLSDISQLAAGSYLYVCNNTATQNYTANTTQNTLTINKASSNVNLLLNGTDGDISVNQGATVNITATAAGPGTIEIRRNGALIQSGNSPLTNISAYAAAGSFNITATYIADQNYTSTYETHFVTVNDVTPPTANITTANDTWTTDVNPSITILLTDETDANINYTFFVNGAANKTGTAANGTATPVTLNLGAEGIYNILVQATDSGNNKANSTQIRLGIDTTIPTTATIVYPANGAWLANGTVGIIINGSDTVSDVLNYTLYINSTQYKGSILNGIAAAVNHTFAMDGTYEVYVDIEDRIGGAGHLRQSSPHTSVNIDSTKPTKSQILSPLCGSFVNNQTPQFTINLSDAMAPTLNYTFLVGGVPNKTGVVNKDTATPVNLALGADGQYNIVLRATDLVGNYLDSAECNITVDTGKPNATINSPANNTWTQDTTPEIIFTISDNVDPILNYTFFVNGIINASGTANNGVPTAVNLSLPNGVFNILVQVTDEANNKVNSTPIKLYIDNTIPNATITSPLNNSWVNDTTPQITFRLTDNLDSVLNYTVYVNGAADVSGTANNNTLANVNLTLLEGTYAIYVEAADETGNKANSTPITLNVDTTDPTSVITSPVNNTWSSAAAIPVTFVLNDTLDSVLNYTLFVNNTINATGLANASVPVTLNLGFAEGAYILRVQAADDFGHKTNSTPVFINVDRTNPNKADITNPLSNQWVNNINVTINLSDNLAPELNYTLLVNGTPNLIGTVNNSQPATLQMLGLVDGQSYDLTVYAEDKVGKWKISSPAVKIFVDTTKPNKSEILWPLNDSWTSNTSPTFTINLSDAVDNEINYTFYINGVKNKTGYALKNIPTNVTLDFAAQGNYNITLEATDNANNSLNSTAMVLHIDTEGPTKAEILSPADGNWTANTTVTIRFNMSDAVDAVLDYTIYVNGMPNAAGTALNGIATTRNVTLGGTDGTYQVVVEARDSAGNILQSGPVNINVDLTTPSVPLIIDPANGAWTNDDSPEYTIYAEDNMADQLTYGFYVGGVSNLTGIINNGTITKVNLTLGSNKTYSVDLRVTDKVGKTVISAVKTITIDRGIPTLNISIPLNSTWTNDNTPQIIFTLKDNMDSVLDYTIYANGNIDSTGTANNNTAKNVNLSTLADGLYNIWVQATDNAGNSFNSTAKTITVDATLPTAAIILPENNSNITLDNITFMLTDNLDSLLNYTFFVNGTANVSGTSNNGANKSVLLNLDDGKAYKVWIQATDEANNKINSTPVEFYLIDITPPASSPYVVQANVSDSDKDGNVEVKWKTDLNATTYSLYRSSEKITTAVGMTPLAANLTGSLYKDNSTLHGTLYWYALTSVDEFGNENKSVVSASYNTTANDTVMPQSPSGFSISSNSGTTSMSWNAVNSDLNGNNDITGMKYNVYRTVNAPNMSLPANHPSQGTALLPAGMAISTTTFSDTTGSAGTFYNYIITSVDDGNNENTTIAAYAGVAATAAPETPAPAPVSSGGGGGGGGGSPKPPKASNMWLPMEIGKDTIMSIKDSRLDVVEIVIIPKANIKDAGLTVEQPFSNPAPTAPNGKVYQYETIEKTKFTNDDIEKAVIRFRVSKLWLVQVNIDESNVALMHYDNEWSELKTSKIASDSSYAYYEATTPRFSYFAIVAKSGATESVAEEANKPIVSEVIGQMQTEEKTPEEKMQETEKITGEVINIPKTRLTWEGIAIIMICVIAIGLGSYAFYNRNRLEAEDIPANIDELHSYVTGVLRMGYPKKDVEKALVKTGWDKKIVRRIIK